MALSGEAKKLYNQAYYQRYKERAWERQLRRERQMMRKAVKRVATVERWKTENPEEEIDPRMLSLGAVWNMVVEEEKAKEQKKRVGVRGRGRKIPQ